MALASVGIGAERFAFRHQAARVAQRAGRLGASRAAAREELLRATRDDLEANANKQVAMDALIFRLRDAR